MFHSNLLLVTFALCGFVLLQTSAQKSGPTNQDIPATGAPSENTCSTEPGCHLGGIYDGTIEFEGLPDTLVRGETYFLTYTFKSNAVRTGFEITCLDEQDKPCGTWIADTGSAVMDNNIHNRTYIRMSGAPYMVDGETQWHFAWTAPLEGNQSTATFYMASLAGNGNNYTTGDNAITNVHSVHIPTTTEVDELHEQEMIVSAAPNPSKGLFYLKTAEPCVANVYSCYGIMIQSTRIAQGSILDLSHLNTGIYYIEFVDGKKSKTQMVYLLQ